MPSALLLILGGDIPGLVAVTPASAAAAKSACAMTDLRNLGDGISLGFGTNASGEVAGGSYLDKVFLFKCGKHTCRFTHNDPFSRTAGTMTDLGTFNATDLGTLGGTQSARSPDSRRTERPAAGSRNCSHHLAERTDTGGGPP